MNKKLDVQNRLFNQTLAETLVDPETGEILLEKDEVIDRRALDRLLPHLEKGIGFHEIKPVEGVIEEPTTIQTVKVYAPNPNGEEPQAINIISNAYVDHLLKMLRLLISLRQ